MCVEVSVEVLACHCWCVEVGEGVNSTFNLTGTDV